MNQTIASKVVYGKEGIKIYTVSPGIEGYNPINPEYWIMIENNTLNEIDVRYNSVVVNGLNIDSPSFFPNALPPGTKLKEPLALLLQPEEEKPIGEIKTIDMALGVTYSDPDTTRFISMEDLGVISVLK